ncbi:hypothetical protein Sango_1906200 [Sesamum angolense]|uniref:MULE transposase domain-containing protein n=1 Tax=Sesamum angolense TaxID=2727404 RepID=A0AAE2BQT1_9LAMI|nr:hypothetical protein Sango_1906200 [Sesamum angolense]
MLIAAVMDGNEQVLPLAFAIVDEETYPSWKWFLQQLSRHVTRGRRGMCLISDSHAGIIKAVREGSDFVSPHGVHRSRRSLQGARMDMGSTPMLSKLPIENAHASSGINLASLVLMLKKYASEDYWDDPNFQLVYDPTIPISTPPGRNLTIRIHNEMDWRQTQESKKPNNKEILQYKKIYEIQGLLLYWKFYKNMGRISLAGTMRGVLLPVVAIDANNNFFPIYLVVRQANKVSKEKSLPQMGNPSESAPPTPQK